ncbi:hypothetical protein [Hahella ganghwensis]|uniref:hypothetical protein n=1 Tax=Hahella ganghwensis TaxID=286420 RepID=UPI000363D544|nr:hypothetical protein [Hahella ganghwensis]
MIKDITAALAAIFLVLGLSACANQQFPAASAEKSVLVISKEDTNSSLEEWTKRYILVISMEDESGNLVDVEKVGLSPGGSSFEVVTGLAPGIYEISRLEWVGTKGWRSSHGVGDGYPLGIPFELEDGKATIVPYVFHSVQESAGSGIRTWFDINPLKYEDKQTLVGELKSLPNAAQWAIK